MTEQPGDDLYAPLTALDQDDPDDAARREASNSVDAAVLRMARASGTEIRQRPAWPGSTVTTEFAAPDSGIHYALMLKGAAGRKLTESIKYARQDGLTWQQIGGALNLASEADERGVALAEAAFDFATDAEHAGRFETLTFCWTCLACNGLVPDRGPSGGHPEDDEPGHQGDCVRLATLVAEYDARWADE